MSRDKGNRAAAWVASYLTAWWPLAEKTPNGRPGADVENTPPVAFEVKTGAAWRNGWLKQAGKYAECDCTQPKPCTHIIPVLVYLPPGCGEANTANAQAIVPLHVMMHVLEEAGYAPARTGATA